MAAAGVGKYPALPREIRELEPASRRQRVARIGDDHGPVLEDRFLAAVLGRRIGAGQSDQDVDVAAPQRDEQLLVDPLVKKAAAYNGDVDLAVGQAPRRRAAWNSRRRRR